MIKFLTPDQPRHALQQYYNVLYALVMHDIKTRFFGNGLGQIVMILWPFVHVIVLLVIFTASGRVAPYGDSTVLYCTTGVIPFILWSYTSRWMVYAPIQNRAYLSYPIIRVLDLIISRAILEVVTGFLVLALVVLTLTVSGVDCRPSDFVQAVCAVGASFLLAFGLGIINGVIGTLVPLWITIYTIFIIVAYASSGVLFIPSNIPDPARYFLSFNPVLQVIEWMRSAYYNDYPRLVLDRFYVIEVGFFTTGLGLVLEILLRRHQRA